MEHASGATPGSFFVCGFLGDDCPSSTFSMLSTMLYRSEVEFRHGFTRWIRGNSWVLEIRLSGEVVAVWESGPIPYDGPWTRVEPQPSIDRFDAPGFGFEQRPMSELWTAVSALDAHFRRICGDSWPTPDRGAGCCSSWLPPSGNAIEAVFPPFKMPPLKDLRNLGNMTLAEILRPDPGKEETKEPPSGR